MRGQRARKTAVEIVRDCVESIGIWQAIASADVAAEQRAKLLLFLRCEFRRFGSCLAEARKFYPSDDEISRACASVPNALANDTARAATDSTRPRAPIPPR